MTTELDDARVAELVHRYDRPGPRYTSYPTAPAWSDGFGPADFEAELARRPADRPLSLYVHIPFCHERCLYCGCNVVITRHEEVAVPYLDDILTDIDLVHDKLTGSRRAVQLHFGGGTPTYLAPAQLAGIVERVFDRFDFDPDAEISIEVDPAVTTLDHIRTLRRLGFNRISMGVQDLDPKVQAAVNREQPASELRAFFDHCRNEGFPSINVDLIYGLPHQSVESFTQTVASILEWGPDRVAMFSYAHVPWIKPHQKLMPEEALPGADEKLSIFLAARRAFLAADYDAIGLDHFARREDELSVARRKVALRRNFMGYTTRPASDVLAFGMSSISELDACYAQNQSRLSKYQTAVRAGELPVHRGARLSAEDRLRRDVIMDLMCNTVIDKARLEATHGIRFDAHFATELRELAPLEEDGLVELTGDRVSVTPYGQLLLRNVAMAFDQYLPHAPDKPLFSRTV